MKATWFYISMYVITLIFIILKAAPKCQASIKSLEIKLHINKHLVISEKLEISLSIVNDHGYN